MFLTLPSFLLYGFLHFKYNEDLPVGKQGDKADALAHKMLEVLNYNAYKSTNTIEWTFNKRHHYKWEKNKNTCEVSWKDYKVKLDLNNHANSKAYLHGFIAPEDLADEIIDKALKYFNNDSFWLVAPYKVFDEGTERQLVKTETNGDALLVTYNSGGPTPGDSYLWLLDANGKPKAFKMWTSLLPIDGLEASWSDWTISESGAVLPTFHKVLVLGLEITHIKTSK